MKWMLAVSAVLACGLVGCKASGKRYFNVSSVPAGATIYIEGEPRGQTDEQRLELNFPNEEDLVTLKLEKEGYQTTGMVINLYSPGRLVFFLQEAPNNRKLLEVLNNLQRTLGQMSAQAEKAQ